MKNLAYFLILGLLLFQASCITTRASLEEQKKEEMMQKNVQSLQKGKADLEVQLQESQSEVRNLVGRIEVLENQLQTQESEEKSKAEANQLEQEEKKKEFSLLIETTSELQQQVKKMSAEISKLEEEVKVLKKKALTKKSPPKRAKKRGNYTQAEYDYSRKNWREAALNYQKYRELNPKGRQYARATYRMGVCFENLKLKDDAKVFYEEVISKYPKSSYAKNARSRVKKL